MAGIADIGAGIGQLFQGQGYDEAAGYAKKNAGLAKLSLGIQLNQQKRTAYQVIGGAKADIASSGLAKSGTALNVLSSSAQQLGLERGLTAAQGQININEWLQKYASDKASAAASYASGAGNILGGLFGIFGG